MNDEKVFIYGTLRDAVIQRSLFGRVLVGSPDALEGYALATTRVKGSAFPNIVPAAGGSVEGEVVAADAEQLRRMDGYETDAYLRKRVVLASGIRAWAYIAE